MLGKHQTKEKTVEISAFTSSLKSRSLDWKNIHRIKKIK